MGTHEQPDPASNPATIKRPSINKIIKQPFGLEASSAD